MPPIAPYRNYFLLAAVVLASALLQPSTFFRHAARLFQIRSHLAVPAVYTNRTYATMAYEKELELALLAVQRASILTKSVYTSHSKGTLHKSDASPVTIGDFGAQALIIASIKSAFPDDEVVGEEDADDLRANPDLKTLVWELVQAAKLSDAQAEAKIGGPIKSPEDMLAALDGGASQGGNKGRIWALDPIDGTKGFLRGGQYAVCLALMVDGVPTVGVIACPNLPIDDKAPLDAKIGENADAEEGKGVLVRRVAR
jgi:3'(2'), 5'-bisphosphate nucleotidase